MKGYELLTSVTDEQFCAKCYSDYLTDCANEYSKLISAMQEAANDNFDIDGLIDEAIEQGAIEDTPEAIKAFEDVIFTDQTITNNRIQTICEKYGINANSPISFNEGYSSVHDVLRTILYSSDINAQENNEDSASAFFDSVLSLTDINGDAVEEQLSASSIIDQMKSNFHSTMAAASAAFASSFNNVQERITVFNDKMSTFFINAYEDLSNSIQYYKSLLTNTAQDAVGICRGICDALNLNELLDSDNHEVNTIDSTSIYQFTGASPQPALDFTTAQKVVETTAKVVSTAVKNTVVGLWNKIVKPGIFKVKQKMQELFVDPYDIELMDESAPGKTVDGWCYEKTYTVPLIYRSDLSIASIRWSGLQWDDIISLINGRVGKWIKFKTIFGECLYRINSITSQDYLAVYGSVTEKFKPFPIDASSIISRLSSFPNTGSIWVTTDSHPTVSGQSMHTIRYKASNTDNLNDIIEALTSLRSAGLLYCNVGTDPEAKIINGFANSFKLFSFFMRVCDTAVWHEISSAVSGTYTCPILTEFDYTDSSNFPTTNKEFIQSVSGWNGSTVSPLFTQNCLYGTGYNCGFSQSEDTIPQAISHLLLAHTIDKYANPYTYDFVPYQNNNANFDDSKYRIKTDDENQQALTTFLTVATIVIIVAVVAISATIAIKKFAKARQWKMREFIGRADNGMWNGQTLTKRAKRKYNRYSKKLNASSNAASGLMDSISSSAASLFTPSQGGESRDIIAQLITG